MAATAGYQVLGKLATALGLDARKVRRFVLDVSIDDAVRLYVEEYPDAEAIERFAGALQGVEVVRTDVPPTVGPDPLLAVVADDAVADSEIEIVGYDVSLDGITHQCITHADLYFHDGKASAYDAFLEADEPIITRNQAVS